jgi:hypothetical protein
MTPSPGGTALRVLMALVFGAVAVLGGMAAVVHSYTASGYVWAVQQVPYYINPANLDMSESAAESAIRTGADAWAMQSNASVAFYYAGRTTGSSVVNNGKNEVFFRNESSPSGYVAVTYWWYDSAGKLVDADILFYDGAYTFATSATGCSGAAYVEDFAAHEFGHALGLRHSSFSDATMYPSTGYCNDNWRTLSTDDIQGVESLYPPGGTQPPSAPTNLTALPSATDPAGSVLLNWTDTASNEEQALVERSADGASWSQVAQLAANTTTHTDPGLTAERTYSYRVRASNTGGFSAYSNTAATTTGPSATPPATLSSPFPSDGANSVSINADLVWSSTGATSFDVYYGTSSSPPLYATGVSAAGLALPQMPYATKYYWRIVARNGAGATVGPTWTFTTQALKAKGKGKPGR